MSKNLIVPDNPLLIEMWDYVDGVKVFCITDKTTGKKIISCFVNRKLRLTTAAPDDWTPNPDFTDYATWEGVWKGWKE